MHSWRQGLIEIGSTTWSSSWGAFDRSTSPISAYFARFLSDFAPQGSSGLAANAVFVQDRRGGKAVTRVKSN
jgi:hypothetical protein